MPLRLQVVTPTERLYDGEVAEVIIPTTSGVIGVLPRHISLTTVTKLGIMNVRTTKEDSSFDHFVITSGVAEVDGENVRVLVDDAEHAASIDEFQAQKAHEEALKRRQTAQTRLEIASVEAAVERHAIRVEAARLVGGSK